MLVIYTLSNGGTSSHGPTYDLRSSSWCKWKDHGRSAGLLTRSLRGIHERADVNNMADLATKLSTIPPTFLRDFLSLEEEDTPFFNDLEEEFVFFFAFFFQLLVYH